MADVKNIRDRWKLAEPLLAELDARDRRAHLEQPIHERLQQTIRLGDAAIQWHPESLDGPDDEHLVWRRIHDHLHGSKR